MTVYTGVLREKVVPRVSVACPHDSSWLSVKDGVFPTHNLKARSNYDQPVQ